MNNLQDATENICDLKGSLMAVNALLTALMDCMSDAQLTQLRDTFGRNAEVAHTVLLHAPISEHTIAGFERDTQRINALLQAR